MTGSISQGTARRNLIGRYLEAGTLRDVVVEYPGANVVIGYGAAAPGLQLPVDTIRSFDTSPDGQSWIATVTEQPAPGTQPRCEVVVDGALDTTSGYQRIVVRNGRLIGAFALTEGGLLDAFADGSVLTGTAAAGGIAMELEGEPLGRPGAWIVDVDGDGDADAGWRISTGAPFDGSPGAFAADGRVVVAATLIAPDQSTHRVVVEAGLALPKSVVCEGMPSSLGAPVGLRLVGSDLAVLNDLSLAISDLPPLSFAMPLASTSTGFMPGLGGGAGTLCLGGSIGRGIAFVQGAPNEGIVSVRLYPSSLPQPTGAVSAAVGETWHFQVWYRDQLGPGVVTSNLSDAISVTFR
ncbi:MAG: hypothetical protein R3F49_24065 [Planctomycetota bacterium]